MLSFRRAAVLARPILTRSLATGPASGGVISDELLQKLGSLSTQALVDGLWVMGWPSAQIDGARPLAKGMKCVGRAVTLKFVPARPDIARDKPAGVDSPEYEAFELCGPNEVRVKRNYDARPSSGGYRSQTARRSAARTTMKD
jgi:regulator of RNase E activity RraA